LGELSRGTAGVLTAPGADLVAAKNAIVVRVHLVETCGGALSGAILGALDEPVARDAASGQIRG
jgi:hypothetical protein